MKLLWSVPSKVRPQENLTFWKNLRGGKPKAFNFSEKIVFFYFFLFFFPGGWPERRSAAGPDLAHNMGPETVPPTPPAYSGSRNVPRNSPIPLPISGPRMVPKTNPRAAATF